MATKRKPGRPKGSGGKQPNWQFTPARQKNLKKARRVNALARKRAKISIVTPANRDAYRRALKNITGKK
ncbi:MAG: hypothetical protein ACWGQW_09705 [bacterium]